MLPASDLLLSRLIMLCRLGGGGGGGLCLLKADLVLDLLAAAVEAALLDSLTLAAAFNLSIDLIFFNADSTRDMFTAGVIGRSSLSFVKVDGLLLGVAGRLLTPSFSSGATAISMGGSSTCSIVEGCLR